MELSLVLLSISRDINMTNSLSREAVLLPLAIGSEVAALLKPLPPQDLQHLALSRHRPPLLCHSWIQPLRGPSHCYTH